MAQVLRSLSPVALEGLLVGSESGDDAAVWRIAPDRALVVTVDFITPIVDDPRTWGRIAATNSISDVYAMGGRPILALNVVGWNCDALSREMLVEVLAGGADVGAENGFATVGGHTVDDPEPKFGLAVVGEVHPDRMLRNTALRAGDRLVLTKALGTGVIATAIKSGTALPEAADAAIASMLRSNAQACAAALASGATGATDVTGFGLLGHLGQMALSSNVDVVVDTAAVPLLAGARDLAVAGEVPGGTRRNLSWVEDRLERGDCDETLLTLLADAQTSGGLIFGAPSDEAAESAVRTLRASGHACAVVGRAEPGRGRLRLA